MNRGFLLLTLIPLLTLLSLSGCSLFTPSTSEGEGVGSNTNWFRACDSTEECSAEMACICGACTKACTETEDCVGLENAACPVDVGVFRGMCGRDEAEAEGAEGFAHFQEKTTLCTPTCTDSADCGKGQLCAAGFCLLGPEPCRDAASLTLRASSESLEARVGGLFGDQFYVPTWYSNYPADFVESYRPSVLTARVTSAAGEPVEGCEVVWLTALESGFAFAAEPLSDASGEATALWVAGSARSQKVEAFVVGRDTTLSQSLSGAAVRHDEEPLSTGTEGRDFTSPSGVSFRIEEDSASDEALIEFVALTFPARVTYSVFTSSLLGIRFTNDGVSDPLEEEVPAEERILSINVLNEEPGTTQVVSLSSGTVCTVGSTETRCTLSGAWEPGETIGVLVQARQVAFGETPSDYQPATHAMDPCLSSVGCTDFSLGLRRAGQDVQTIARLRAGGTDTMQTHTAGISGIYSAQSGTAGSCLETPQASLQIRHEMNQSGATSQSGVTRERGRGYFSSAHETWQNQICANYALLPSVSGLYMSTGGPTTFPTPVLPGEELSF